MLGKGYFVWIIYSLVELMQYRRIWIIYMNVGDIGLSRMMEVLDVCIQFLTFLFFNRELFFRGFLQFLDKFVYEWRVIEGEGDRKEGVWVDFVKFQ